MIMRGVHYRCYSILASWGQVVVVVVVVAVVVVVVVITAAAAVLADMRKLPLNALLTWWVMVVGEP